VGCKLRMPYIVAIGLLLPATAAADLDACSATLKRSPAEALAVCRDAQTQAAASGRTRDSAIAQLEHASAAVALARYDEAQADIDDAERRLTPAHWRDQHRIERQRGVLAYRRERLAEAALHFGRALDLARTHDDAEAQAQSWNDMGNAYRRIGDFAAALQAFSASLALREGMGQAEQAAAVLNNIGNVQQDLGDPVAAQDWLERALAAYRRVDAPRQVAHVLESLGLNDRERGDDDAARDKLREAWDVYTAQGAVRDRLRVATHLAGLEAERGGVAAAAGWIAEARALIGPSGTPPPLALLLAETRSERARGESSPARRSLRERLAGDAGDAVADRVAAWQYLAEASEQEGDAKLALADARALRAVSTEQARRVQNERVAQWQVRLDLAGRQRQIDELREQTQRLATERLRLRLLLALGGALLLLVVGALLLHLQRQRAAAAVQRQALQHQNARYRAAAAALRADRQRLQALADRGQDALLLSDARGRVVAANRAAAALLGRDSTELPGLLLTDLLGTAAHAVAAAIARLEDDASTAPVDLGEMGPRRLQIRCGLLDEADAEETVTWLRLEPAAAAATPETPETAPPAATASLPAGSETLEASDAFRRRLVELMQATLQAWERATRQSRVEFAEKSGIWRIHVDDGRLRMRSMERYLNLAKLPRHPRWREVLRSAYFVLAECALEPTERGRLEALVEAIRTDVSARALE